MLEGEFRHDETRAEGPFGEFTGYYASHVRDEPVVRVRRVYHRNDPILTMASPMRPPTDVSFAKCIVQSGMIWDEIESAGLSGVKGVWCHEAGAIRMFIVVSIEQMHPGHAQQAGMLVAACHSGNYAGRWVVVVDSDIDPTNLDDVIWAMSTRCDPVRRYRNIKRAWSTPLDPMLREPPWESTRAIVNACRPWSLAQRIPGGRLRQSRAPQGGRGEMGGRDREGDRAAVGAGKPITGAESLRLDACRLDACRLDVGRRWSIRTTLPVLIYGRTGVP